MVTVSVPTVPDAEELSPYEIFHVSPEEAFQVLLEDGLKMVWPADFPWDWMLWLRLVDQTQRSEEPVSKSSVRV